jgi:hypothetical protein
MTADKSTIIEKVKKLLALSANAGATEGEAENAATMASAICLKYGLDMAAIQKSNMTQGAQPGMTDGVVFVADKYEQWVWLLVAGVAELNGAKAYYVNWATSVRYYVIGRPMVIEVAKMTVEYLFGAVRRLNTQAVKNYEAINTPALRRDFRAGFRIACASRLYQRMVARKEEMRARDDVAKAATGSTALVVADHFAREETAIMQWMEEQGFKVKEKKAKAPNMKSNESFLGMSEGNKAGNKIGLDAQVQSSSGKSAGFIK